MAEGSIVIESSVALASFSAPCEQGGQYREKPANPEGWLVSGATGIQMQATGAGKLRIRLENEPASQAELPED